MIITNLRPALAQHLSQRLHAFREGFRRNLALIGPPGSGKTFQLQQLLGRHQEELLLIYCPLYRESCRSFLQRFLSALIQSGLQVVEPCSVESAPLDVLLERAQARLPKTVAAVGPIEGLLTRRLYGEAFTRALDVVPLLIRELEKPCVLILDEFLLLEELGLSHGFHELGKRVMTWPTTLFVLSSSSPYRARAILRERLQLLFGQFELLTAEALDAETVSRWVQHELKGLRGARAMTPFLLKWLGASPWYLTVFLKRLRELAALAQQRDFDESLFLRTAWDVLGNGEGTLHQWCVSRTEPLAHLRHGRRAMEALMHVAQGARTATEIGRRIGRASLTEALQLLVTQDLAQRNGTCWMVPDPILRCWVSTVVLSQRSDVRPDDEQTRQRLEAYLRSAWAHWMQTHRLSFSAQVAGLFGRFSDETLSLDSKTGRLPHFDRIITQPAEASGAHAYLVADGAGKRWCATVQEGPVEESAVASFDAFCRQQTPKPSRKIVVTKSGMGENAKVLAKAANMWIWEAADLDMLSGLYGNA